MKRVNPKSIEANRDCGMNKNEPSYGLTPFPRNFGANCAFTMRKNFLIACVAVLAVCLLLLVFKANHHTIATFGPGATSANTPAQPAPAKTAQNVAAVTNALKGLKTPSAALVSGTGISDALESRILASWQAPIDFYGKVIDQSSNPIEGAEISFHWVEKPTEDGNRSASATSDDRGLFSLHNALGLSLAVSVSKDGYYTSRKDNDTFTYGSAGGAKYSPDPFNPAIFHLRKRGRGASLIEMKFPPGMRIAQLHHDGTPVELDLLNGTQASAGNGQLELRLLHDISNSTKFDWKLQISASSGGGIVRTDDEFAFEAPINGYQPSIIVDMPATNQVWYDNFSAKYYIQLPNGDYGRFDLDLLAHNGAFTVTSAINPSGSRDLEPPQ